MLTATARTLADDGVAIIAPTAGKTEAFTVRVTAELVILPTELLTVTVYTVPEFEDTAVVEYDVDVAPEIGTPLLLH